MKMPSKSVLDYVYGENKIATSRFESLVSHFKSRFNSEEVEFFSSPGRTEIIGNHTDHNGGKVLAASIDMDTIGVASQNHTNIVTIVSEGYDNEIEVDLTMLDGIPKNQGTLSLVAGIVEASRNLGIRLSGFNAYISSNVISSAGVSSSASFEMLICSMINYFFHNNSLSYIDYAKMGQYAENNFWNKSSGLMDQIACAVGGTIMLDFSEDVKYEKLDFSFHQINYDLLIINTGKGHADLSDEYSKVPLEMKLVAERLDKINLSKSNLSNFLKELPQLEPAIANDRAILRTLHFFEENNRVERAISAIQENDSQKLIKLIEESGNSSWKWLQNCYCASNVKEQRVSLLLALSEIFLKRIGDGCCRVHGGGFAGIIMNILPKNETDNYIRFISKFVRKEEIHPVRIREAGAIHLNF